MHSIKIHRKHREPKPTLDWSLFNLKLFTKLDTYNTFPKLYLYYYY